MVVWAVAHLGSSWMGRAGGNSQEESLMESLLESLLESAAAPQGWILLPASPTHEDLSAKPQPDPRVPRTPCQGSQTALILTQGLVDSWRILPASLHRSKRQQPWATAAAFKNNHKHGGYTARPVQGVQGSVPGMVFTLQSGGR